MQAPITKLEPGPEPRRFSAKPKGERRNHPNAWIALGDLLTETAKAFKRSREARKKTGSN